MDLISKLLIGEMHNDDTQYSFCPKNTKNSVNSFNDFLMLNFIILSSLIKFIIFVFFCFKSKKVLIIRIV